MMPPLAQALELPWETTSALTVPPAGNGCHT